MRACRRSSLCNEVRPLYSGVPMYHCDVLQPSDILSSTKQTTREKGRPKKEHSRYVGVQMPRVRLPRSESLSSETSPIYAKVCEAAHVDHGLHAALLAGFSTVILADAHCVDMDPVSALSHASQRRVTVAGDWEKHSRGPEFEDAPLRGVTVLGCPILLNYDTAS